ncbi:MAG: ParM/StbA family protein [Deltaproteobacteria bacterium]|nr:ParM/StbA family protein [Deltaproteobacteria bacterium]
MNLGVGIDVGYGHTKALSSTGASVVFPSAVGLADPQTFRLHLNGRGAPTAHERTVQVDDVPYFVGEAALRHARAVVQPRDRDWLDSLAYRILWYAALESVLLPGTAPTIVTGLPVSFYHDRDRLQQVVAHVLAARHSTALQVRVVPQPFGSFFDALFDAQGQLVNDAPALAHSGIIDVGYFTTDVVEVQELEYVQKGSGSIGVGVATMLDTLRGLLTQRFGYVVSVHEAEQVLRNQRLRRAGQEHDFSAECTMAVRDAALAILTYVHQLWGAGDQFDQILLTGGGGVIVQAFFTEQIPQLQLAPTPMVANARGYVRYALYCGRQSR